MTLNDRLDGHIVQGHVDGVLTCQDRSEVAGSWEFSFEVTPKSKHLLIPKGSICLNGVSLTVADLRTSEFKVAIIPYTYENTTFKILNVGDSVNVEYDVLGKYVSRNLQLKNNSKLNS